MTTNNEILKMGIQELYDKNKITLTLKSELTTYVDDNVDESYLEIKYSDFSSVNSTGVTFNSEARTITNTTSAELVTNVIASLDEKILKGFKLKCSAAELITYQFSTDLLNWFDLSENNTNELIETSTLYIKCKYSSAQTVTGLYILYII